MHDTLVSRRTDALHQCFLVSLLNEQNPHCYIHSTQYFPFLFQYVTNSTVLCCKSVTLNNNKKVGGGGGGVNSYL